MLKENWRLISRLERVGDFLIIILSFFVAYYGRDSLIYWNQKFHWGLPFETRGLAPWREYFTVIIVALVSYPVFLNMMGAYSSMRLSTHFQLLKISVFSSVIVFFILGAVLFLLKLDLSRSLIALFCILVGLSLTFERFVVLRVLRYWRQKGMNFRNVLVCGTGEQAIKVAHEINSKPELGIRIRGFVDLREHGSLNDDILVRFRLALRKSGYERIGRIILGTESLEKAMKQYAIDEVIFTDVIEVMPQVQEMVIVCSDQGVRTTIAADLFSMGMVKSGLSYFGEMPLIHFQTPPGDQWELTLKRWIDIAVASFLLILLFPVFLLIAIAVRLDSNGPIIFSQKRVGLNGRLFSLYKFRSMRLNADEELSDLKEKNEMHGPVFKIKNDPRITFVGRFLRRFSLDELPQFWNVFKGDMSLVGPRPPIPGEVSLYERRDRRRLSMRPGITCTWQVSGRNEIDDFEKWVKLDLDYIDNWSLSRDLGLLFRTIPAVIFGHGAR